MVLGFLKGFMVDGRRKQTNFEDKIKKGIKLHTIRWDGKDRWKKGRKIHFAHGVRTNNYNCFKEGICISTQKIEIQDRTINVDGYYLSSSTIEYLSINDGFDSLEDFWAWFDVYSPFAGKIIHWTDLEY